MEYIYNVRLERFSNTVRTFKDANEMFDELRMLHNNFTEFMNLGHSNMTPSQRFSVNDRKDELTESFGRFAKFCETNINKEFRALISNYRRMRVDLITRNCFSYTLAPETDVKLFNNNPEDNPTKTPADLKVWIFKYASLLSNIKAYSDAIDFTKFVRYSLRRSDNPFVSSVHVLRPYYEFMQLERDVRLYECRYVFALMRNTSIDIVANQARLKFIETQTLPDPRDRPAIEAASMLASNVLRRALEFVT